MEETNIIKLSLDENNYCKICLFGATIISWINDGEEYIFLSSKAKFDNKSAIRGGIPIIFPCFGPWNNGPQHGFARISQWLLSEKPQINNNCAKTELILKWNEDTLKMWNFKFSLRLEVSLRNKSLSTKVDVFNEDDKDFDFTFLFHTYLRTPFVNDVQIEGLRGCQVIDKISNKDDIEQREMVIIDKAVDRIYKSTNKINYVHNVTGNKSITIVKENLPDTVVWNPWKEKALSMSDLGEEYKEMICVEAGHIMESIKISPVYIFTASQVITISE